MNRSIILQQLVSKLRIAVIGSCILWIILLERGALILRGQNGNAHYDVMAGPLVLNHLSSQKHTDKVLVNFSFELGLVWYVLFWLLVGTLWAILATYMRKRAISNSK